MSAADWKGCTGGLFAHARHLDLRGIAATIEQAAAIYGLCGDEPFTFEEVHLVLVDRCIAFALTEPQIAKLLAAGALPLDGVVPETAEGPTLPDGVVALDDIFCVCGDADTAWAWVRDYLSGLHNRKDDEGWAWKPESGPEYVSVYLLDHLGLTEHGSTVRCPWLTDAGREVLAFLEEHGADWHEGARREDG